MLQLVCEPRARAPPSAPSHGAFGEESRLFFAVMPTGARELNGVDARRRVYVYPACIPRAPAARTGPPQVARRLSPTESQLSVKSGEKKEDVYTKRSGG